jgi:hypothetical protein
VRDSRLALVLQNRLSGRVFQTKRQQFEDSEDVGGQIFET